MKKEDAYLADSAYSDRLSALGLMVGGFAHDMNNLIGLIMGFGELLEEENLSEEGHSFLQKIIAATDKASELLKWVSNFSRRRISHRGYFSHYGLLEKSILLPGAEIRASSKQLKIAKDSFSKVETVLCDDVLLCGALSRIVLFLGSVPSPASVVSIYGSFGETEVSYCFEIAGSDFTIEVFREHLTRDNRNVDGLDARRFVSEQSVFDSMSLTIAQAIIEFHDGKINATDTGYEVVLPVASRPEESETSESDSQPELF